MPDFITYYFEQLKDAGQALSDPVFAYELLIHGPGLLAAAALLLVLALTISLGKSPALRYTSMVFFGLAALAAVGAWQYHGDAELLLASVDDELAAQRFEQLLQWSWAAPAAACLILLCTVSAGKKLRTTGLVLGVLLSAAAVISGGLLSYNHLIVHEPALAEAIGQRQSVQTKTQEPDEMDESVDPPAAPSTENPDAPDPENNPDEEESNTFFGLPL